MGAGDKDGDGEEAGEAAGGAAIGGSKLRQTVSVISKMTKLRLKIHRFVSDRQFIACFSYLVGLYRLCSPPTLGGHFMLDHKHIGIKAGRNLLSLLGQG